MSIFSNLIDKIKRSIKKRRLIKLSNLKIDKTVKIAGTDFDRRRKLTTSDVKDIKQMYRNGWSISRISEMYEVAYATVKYHLDDEFKNELNSKRKNYSYRPYNYDEVKDRIEDRAEYKKNLVIQGKIIVD